MTNTKFRWRVFKSRLVSLKKDVKIFACIAIGSILLIELILSNYPSPFRLTFSLGQVYLKLCYSYISALLFYILVIHYPRERRRVKSFRFLSNKITNISHENVTFFCSFSNELGIDEVHKLTKVKIEELSRKLNPLEPIIVREKPTLRGTLNFPNQYEHLDYRRRKIVSHINSLLVLGDIVDNDLIYCLTCLDDVLTHHLNVGSNLPANKDMEYLSHWFLELNFLINELNLKFFSNYQKYQFEYTVHERKGNHIKYSMKV